MKNEALFNTLKAGVGNGLKCKTSLGVMQLTEINMTSRWTCWFGYDNKINSKHFNANICVKNGLVSKGFYPKKIKPYLFSTEDLVNEIKINGEKFVPALELVKLQQKYNKWIDNAPSVEYTYKIVQKPFGKILKVSKLDKWVLIISLDEPERSDHFIFEQLCRWNFNVFNLPEDQYIRVTNVNNPYK